MSLHGLTAVLITREKAWPKEAMPEFPFDEVLIETECLGVHRRFELALQAKYDHIYVQDDDCKVSAQSLMHFYDFAHLTYAITEGHKKIYDDLCASRVCLIGWGAVFPKHFADPARWKSYVEKYGPVPSHEADRVFTWFCDQPSQPVFLPIGNFQRDRAMSRDNKQHYSSRAEIIKNLQALEAE